MLPMSYSSASNASLYGSSQSMNFADVPGGFSSQPFGSQTFVDISQVGAQDPNSPETFKQNIMTILEQIMRVQGLARHALDGIEHAYRSGTNPIQTAADLASVKQATDLLQELLRQSGVGALPLLNPQAALPPTEEDILVDTNKAIQELFDKHKQLQETSGVVANLLSATDPVPSAKR
ncbi:hypothetical protein K474DRAFT_1077766 [Panus rudis PR-1116 ss-1]|nr:hypothetical protein K474DRAFT_1077766 [Panus rudis PR-1116 ss-1]